MKYRIVHLRLGCWSWLLFYVLGIKTSYKYVETRTLRILSRTSYTLPHLTLSWMWNKLDQKEKRREERGEGGANGKWVLQPYCRHSLSLQWNLPLCSVWGFKNIRTHSYLPSCFILLHVRWVFFIMKARVHPVNVFCSRWITNMNTETE